MTLTRSDRSLDQVRADVLNRGLTGPALRAALSDAYDAWLAALVRSLIGPATADAGPETVTGVALIAVGGLGRREPAPYSDLDLVLLYQPRTAGHDMSELADAIWYPIWDAGIGLDHSVRTPDEAVAVARDDLKALLGLLDLRHLAGDRALSGPLRERVYDLWRGGATARVDQLRELTRQRWATAGEAAFLLEPNLKESAGGLRDAQTLAALAAAQLVDVPASVRAARTTLLDVRGQLQQQTGRAEDTLRQQEHQQVATALGLAEADDVLREVNIAARAIGLAVTSAWRRVSVNRAPARGRLTRLVGARRPADAPSRVGLAKDVVAQGGEIVLARDADPWADPLLVLRAARAAAEHDLPLAPFAVERLASESAPIPTPWSSAAFDEFVCVLGGGPASVPVLETLDQAGLLARLIPEWDAVRFKIQHNPVHRFTVDRHLLETAAQAATLTRQVARPDLLLVGALLHDIGKGDFGGGSVATDLPADLLGDLPAEALADHSTTGAVVAGPIARRMGLGADDVATVVALVRHHLLLPDTATRRDLDDPVTITTVADAVGGSVELLDLLHALTIADAAATGPLVWSDWKAGLIAELVQRTRLLLAGAQPPTPAPLDARRRELAEAGALAVHFDASEVIVAAPDGIGVLSRTAGVLALHSLDVRAATISTHARMAVNAFVVEPRFGQLPDPAVVRNDLARAIDGTLPLADRLARKEQAYERGAPARRRPPAVQWFDDAATDATVLELRADDSIGLLYRVTVALEQLALDVRSARVSSLGGTVVDAFYLTTGDGLPIPLADRGAIELVLGEIR